MPREEVTQDVVGHLAVGKGRSHGSSSRSPGTYAVTSVAVKLSAAVKTMLAALTLGSSTVVPGSHIIVYGEAFVESWWKTVIVIALLHFVLGCVVTYFIFPRYRPIRDHTIIELRRELRTRAHLQWKCIQDYCTNELRRELSHRGYRHPMKNKGTHPQCCSS